MRLILHSLIGNDLHHAEALTEMFSLIDAAFDALEASSRHPYYPFEDHAQFMFSDRRHAGGFDWPNNFLFFSANVLTGYGGLIWGVCSSNPKKGGIYDSIWVSDNPSPPDFDPYVASDPGQPAFHDPRNAIPIPLARQAVEEYCREGTGERPECADWVRGDLKGTRLQRRLVGDFIAY